METIVKATDMSQEAQDKVLAMLPAILDPLLAGTALERDVAHELKTQLDTEFGSTWHVVVGKNFGSFVTHEQGNFMYCYRGAFAVLLFKTA